MPSRPSSLFVPRLPPIPEQPTPPPPPQPVFKAGDRVLVATRDSYLRTGVVVARAGAAGTPPVLWVRLSTGRPVPLDCPDITILRRL